MCFGSSAGKSGSTTTVNSGQKAQVATNSEEATPSGARRKIKEETAARKATILTSQQGDVAPETALGGKTLLGS